MIVEMKGADGGLGIGHSGPLHRPKLHIHLTVGVQQIFVKLNVQRAAEDAAHIRRVAGVGV